MCAAKVHLGFLLALMFCVSFLICYSDHTEMFKKTRVGRFGVGKEILFMRQGFS